MQVIRLHVTLLKNVRSLILSFQYIYSEMKDDMSSDQFTDESNGL